MESWSELPAFSVAYTRDACVTYRSIHARAILSDIERFNDSLPVYHYMDLLQNCTSGVHLINCFQNINFHVYTPLEGDDGKQPSSKRTLSTHKLRGIEVSLYERVALLSLDLERKEIWAFSGSPSNNNEATSSQSNFISDLDDVFKAPSDYGVKLFQKGTVKPGDLLAEDTRTEVGSWKPFNLAHIYRCFLSACTKSISRKLAQCGFVPLNIRTFAAKAESRQDYAEVPRWDILSFNLQLIPTGCLRIGTRWETNMAVSRLSDMLENPHLAHYYETPLVVRIAPCGDLALAWPFFTPTDSTIHSRSVHSHPTVLFQSLDRGRWRESVCRWLKSKNLQAPNMYNDFEWIKILMSCSDRNLLRSVSKRHIETETICVEWPSRLCFLQDNDRGRYDGRSVQQDDLLGSTSWFQHSNMPGFEDPLQFALDWIEHKSYRESEVESRLSRVPIEVEDAPVAQDTSPGVLDWLSLNDSNNSTTQEAQQIYPTPSDGLPNQVTPSAVSADANFVSAGGPIDTSLSTIDHMEVEEKPASPASGEHTQLVRHSSFGDNDRYIGAMTLTDMDFDFFNQPEDIPMDTTLTTQAMELPVDVENGETFALEPIDEENENSPTHNDGIPLEPSLHVSVADPDNSSPNIDESAGDYHNIPVIGDDIPQFNENLLEPNLSSQNNLVGNEEPFDDSKYSGGGRFGFGPRNQARKRKFTNSETVSIKRHLNQQFSTSIRKPGRDSSHQRQAPESDDEDSEGETSTESHSDRSPWLTLHGSRKGDGPFDASAGQATAGSVETTLHGNRIDFNDTANEILAQTFTEADTGWILTPFLRTKIGQTTFEPYLQSLEPNEKTFIVQLLARQLVFGLLSPSSLKVEASGEQLNQSSADSWAANIKLVSQAISGLAPASSCEEVDLAHYLLWGSAEAATEKGRTIAPIIPAHVSVQKAGDMWDLGAAAAPFWETLGLEPRNGPKTVSAFVVYPWSDAIEESIDHFLQAIESSWQGHKLGGHVLGYLDDGSHPGHIPVQLGTFDHEHDLERLALKSYLHTCHNLGIRLKNTLRPEDTAVVYMVNAFKDPTALPKLCECFMAVLKAYGAALSSTEQLEIRNIVLQIVPIELVASPNAPVFLDPERTATIAHKVYGACPCHSRKSTSESLAIQSGASLTLAKTIPKNIRFQLSTTPSAYILAEGSRIHVAYSESSCSRWVSAAWIDDTGENQHTAFYSRNEKVEMSAIIQEIWQTTLDIIGRIKVHWRIIVARAGTLPMREKNVWHDLAAKGALVHHALCLVSVETDPCLRVSVKSSVKAMLLENGSITTNHHATPVTTPHPLQNSSPAPVSPSHPAGSTPSNTTPFEQTGAGDIDSYAQLIDKADESWGFVLPRRLNVTNSTLDFNHALASGYLVKRTGVSDDDEPVLIEVNLMHLQEVGKVFSARQAYEELQTAKGRRYEKILGEILIMFRNLGLLARLQKIEGVKSCTPWHVAVAVRGTEGLRKYTDL